MPQQISSLIEIPSVRLYLNRIGADPRSLTTAVVRELHGKYYTDIAVIRLDPVTGAITATDPATRKPLKAYEPTSEQSQAIRDEISNYYFPKPKRVQHYVLPQHLASAPYGTIFPFKDRNSELIMLVQRVDSTRSDEKTYLPWTLFDDDEWRQCEPGDKLPLYGLEDLEGDTVFLHEGPKKAWHCNNLFRKAHTDIEIAVRDAHPWKDALSAGVHLAWHGGALSPYRTDWSALKLAGVKNVYIIPDNDAPGVQAVKKISPYLRDMNVCYICWNSMFKASFDLADQWPNGPHFYQGDYYIGPKFEDLLAPATWATDKFQEDPKKKPTITIRKKFAEQWRYVSGADLYINTRFPYMCYTQSIFDKVVAAFSDHPSTSILLNAAMGVHTNRLVYRPDLPTQGTYDVDAPAAINTYIPPRIKSVSGNSKIFENFLDYMFVIDAERHQVRRYLATLIAKPEIRMTFSQLWISTTHGIGKTTLGEKILAPLLGPANCSFPSEQMIVDSQFNTWMVKKRLVFVGEIYGGHSWKAYNKLKSFITDEHVTVNEKYVKEYKLDNWAHIIACSNSEKALKIEKMDRRWYCPELAMVPWKRDKFVALYEWIRTGGLPIIKHWAETFGDYVEPGENAQPTARKSQMIEESLTEEERTLASWCQAFNEDRAGHEMVVSDRIIKSFLTNPPNNLPVRFVSPLDLRNVLKEHGWVKPSFQLNIDGLTQAIMMSPACAEIWRREISDFDKLGKEKQSEWRDWLRKRLRSMSDPDGKGQEFMNRVNQIGI